MRRVYFFELSVTSIGFIVALVVALIWPSRPATVALVCSALAFAIAVVRALMGPQWPGASETVTHIDHDR
jgi:hypothetical protein